MRSKRLLTQALKLKNKITFNQVKKLVEIAREYQKENGELFLKAQSRKNVEILDEDEFFKFLSDASGIRVKNLKIYKTISILIAEKKIFFLVLIQNQKIYIHFQKQLSLKKEIIYHSFIKKRI